MKTDAELRTMNENAHFYMKQVLEAKKSKLLEVVVDDKQFDLEVGRLIQLEYCQGYDDCHNHAGVKRLIF